MVGEGSGASSAAKGFAAYDRATLDRFFADAQEQYARLMADIADARRRIARAEAALRATGRPEHDSVHAILEAQRQLREECRANERDMAAIRADADADVEEILREARMRSDDVGTDPGHDRSYLR